MLGALALVLGGCTPPPPEEEPAWRLVLDAEDLEGVVLSVGGSGPDDVFAVGGPLGNRGFESLVVHWDGGRWRALRPGGTETYWWVAGSGPQDMWMVGTGGRITHWDGTRFVEHASGTSVTLWGVWAASPTEAWAVGGLPGRGTGAPGGNDVVLRWDGVRWTRVALPGTPRGAALFKVWGRSPADLFIVGEGGTLWHRVGETWRLESDDALSTDSLLTVTGCGASEVYAVGGLSVLRHDGTAWSRVDAAPTGSVNGVACDDTGQVLLVGAGGFKRRRVDGVWRDELTQPPTVDLHAAWADGRGAFWVGGGDFVTGPVADRRRRGVVGRFGTDGVTGVISP